MVIERRWKKWVYFYIPLTVFVIGTLFPFYWMLDHRHPPRRRALPLVAGGEQYAVLDAAPPRSSTSGTCWPRPRFPMWLWNTFFIACVSTIISLFCGLLAGYALARLKFPLAGIPRHRDLRHLPGAADAALHPARRHHPQLPARQHAVGADPHLSDVPDPVLHLAPDGLLQDHPQGAGGVRAHRRRHALRRHGAHHLPDRGARHPVGRHLRLHAVLERVHLRAGLPVLAREEDGPGGRGLGADPRRHLLLGPADGRARCSARSRSRSSTRSSSSTTSPA